MTVIDDNQGRRLLSGYEKGRMECSEVVAHLHIIGVGPGRKIGNYELMYKYMYKSYILLFLIDI